MARARWKHHSVPSTNGDFMAALAAQNQSSVTSCKSEYFMRGGVVVMKVINSVPPLRRPAICPKHRFESRRGIGDNTQQRAVQQDRKTLIVRHPTVARKAQDLR